MKDIKSDEGKLRLGVLYLDRGIAVKEIVQTLNSEGFGIMRADGTFRQLDTPAVSTLGMKFTKTRRNKKYDKRSTKVTLTKPTKAVQAEPKLTINYVLGLKVSSDIKVALIKLIQKDEK